MEVHGPITVEEMQEANILAVPKLLRGSVRRRARGALRPSKWRLAYLGVLLVLFLIFIATNPDIGAAGKWPVLLVLIGVFVYRVFFAAKVARQGYERRIRRMPRVLSVDSDGVRFEDRNKAFQFRPWSAYKIWREGSLVFVLRGPQRLFHVFPRRGLTREQVDRLRVLLATHMPESA